MASLPESASAIRVASGSARSGGRGGATPEAAATPPRTAKPFGLGGAGRGQRPEGVSPGRGGSALRSGGGAGRKPRWVPGGDHAAGGADGGIEGRGSAAGGAAGGGAADAAGGGMGRGSAATGGATRRRRVRVEVDRAGSCGGGGCR